MPLSTSSTIMPTAQPTLRRSVFSNPQAIQPKQVLDAIPKQPAKVGASLAQALVAASWVTHHVAAGQSLPAVLRELAPTLANPSLRGACQDLAYQTQRQRGRADALIIGLTKKPFDTLDKGVLALLRVALAMLCNPSEYQAYEAHTVVNQAVLAVPALLACGLGKTLPQFCLVAHSNQNTKVVAGFINGVLRTYLREQLARHDVVLSQPEALFNHPNWWIKQLQQDYPSQWQDLLHNNNRPPVMALRANARIHNAIKAQEHLAQHGITAHCVAGLPNALVLDKPLPVEQIPGFIQGWYSVQDLAAQYCVELLDLNLDLDLDSEDKGNPNNKNNNLNNLNNLKPSLKILDACAAPGGKTAHILERANVTLTALDNDPQRLEKLRHTLQRLARTFVGDTPYAAQPLVELKTANANQTEKWWDKQAFDRIILDAPCSASGVVRRHPDSRWLRRASDIVALTQQQAALLESLWPCLKVGGLLLYVTCSVFKAEGEAQMTQFLARHAEATLLPTLGHCLPVLNSNSNLNSNLNSNSNSNSNLETSPAQTAPWAFPNPEHDGFFYALLRKVY